MAAARHKPCLACPDYEGYAALARGTSSHTRVGSKGDRYTGLLDAMHSCRGLRALPFGS